jgi:hypothetical protein
MEDQLIFISCGQVTDLEKTVGSLLKAAVDGVPGYQGYFAETVHDLEALAQNVLKGLQNCSGAIVILQDRGTVIQTDGSEWGHRSSVWVNQEIAILAYRQYCESKRIPILVFAEPTVKLEGAMTSLIVNPQPLPPPAQLASIVRTWLAGSETSAPQSHIFVEKWDQLPDAAKMAVVVVVEEGGTNVKESIVRQGIAKRLFIDTNAADSALRDAKLYFMKTDLIKLVPNIRSGDELSANPTWKHQLQQQCGKWLSSKT